jgi:membrane associated rhomboid family serine protease
VTRTVQALIIANVIAYFLQSTQPALFSAFVFYPPLAFVRPWTFVTYMFLHGSMMHILFNMLGLYFFGSAVEGRMGQSRFLSLYFVSGITGALLSMVFSSNSPIIGASGGVFGVMLAFARYWPETVILVWGIIPVPARVMVIINTVMSIWFGFGGTGGNTAHFAHLGGFAGAWLYLKWWERGRTDFKKRAVAGPVEVVNKKIEGWRSIDATRIHEVNRGEVLRLIEKASKNGIGALTPEERLFLSNFVPTDTVPPPT